MKLLVGLGNPGRRYAGTRHNVGARVVREFGARHGIALREERFAGFFGAAQVSLAGHEAPGPVADGSVLHVSVALDVAILAPQTYMNRSGESVAAALAQLPIEDPASNLWLVYDDVDLSFGRLRVRPSGGAGGHRGLSSVIEHVGGQAFPRLRFGVGRPEPDADAAEHVLESFSAGEEDRLEAAISRAADCIEAGLGRGLNWAMSRYNADPSAQDGNAP